MSDLLARRQAVLERFKVLESVPGSGCHDSDPSGPVKQGQVRHSQRPVLLIDDQECWLVGDDVHMVLGTVAAYVEREKPNLSADSLPEVLRACNVANLLRPSSNGSPELKLARRHANDVIYMCGEMGLPVNGTGVKG